MHFKALRRLGGEGFQRPASLLGWTVASEDPVSMFYDNTVSVIVSQSRDLMLHSLDPYGTYCLYSSTTGIA